MLGMARHNVQQISRPDTGLLSMLLPRTSSASPLLTQGIEAPKEPDIRARRSGVAWQGACRAPQRRARRRRSDRPRGRSARIARLQVLPDAVTTAPAAAAALGIAVGQIANSLLFDADGQPLLVMTSGAHRVDTGKVAAFVGAERVRRATPEFVRAATGQAIGGVAPVGHPAPVRTLVDRALAEFDEVWAAGGIAHSVFPTTFAELVDGHRRRTGGRRLKPRVTPASGSRTWRGLPPCRVPPRNPAPPPAGSHGGPR